MIKTRIEDDERSSTGTTNKTYKKWEKWLWTMAESQRQKSLITLAYRLAQVVKFFRMFWVWNAWQQHFFQNCWNFNKNSGEWKWLRSHWWCQRWSRITETCYKTWQKMDTTAILRVNRPSGGILTGQDYKRLDKCGQK